MKGSNYTIEVTEEIDLRVELEITEEEENFSKCFGSFEVDPDDDEDIFIPGTDEKIG